MRPLPRKDLVGPDMDDDVQIARRSSEQPALALTDEPLEEVLENAAKADVTAPARPDHGAEAIVLGAFLGIGKHAVRLVDLLEAFLGFLVAGVPVGVMRAR